MADIEQMRKDFKRIAGRLVADGWSDSDLNDLREAVKAAIESGEAERIDYWARWLADQAAQLEALAALCRAAEARIRAQMERLKKKAA